MRLPSLHTHPRPNAPSPPSLHTHAPLLPRQLPPDGGRCVGHVQRDGVKEPVCVLRVHEEALGAADDEAASW